MAAEKEITTKELLSTKLGTMVCWHRRYNIGDNHDYADNQELFYNLVSDSLSTEEIIAYVKDGNAKGLKLVYNDSTQEWELESYWGYTKKWYVEYSNPFIDMADDALCSQILNNMYVPDLKVLVGQKHLILPIYLYDHSTQSISTTSFIGRAQHAEWDSGQIGWIFVSHDDIIKRYGDISAETLEIVRIVLDNEIKDYNSYFNGESD